MRVVPRILGPPLRRGLALGLLLPGALAGAPGRAAPDLGTRDRAAVDFNRDIRPILTNNCFACHGPDEKERQAGLRLDRREGAIAPREGVRAIVPGDPEASELLRRVRASDPEDRMPPPESGEELTPREVDLLERWIGGGAPYEEHWSYVPPRRPPLPEVHHSSRARGAIDRFVLARIEEESLEPSPEAERAALIRRVSLDLTGLPPTPEEVDRFIADPRPDAYERLVDRLLASPAYGEHWARMWLDLARYADSAGYADDPPRTIWAYRDWVIRAFNENRPFDRFTVEQIAGDLLPEPGEDQLIATAFHRNTQTNNEGGTDDEEFRNVAVVDRVNTTMAVWMGTTMACAQCHNHKYDPISQEEYFRFFALFNSTADADRRDERPVLELFSAAEKRRKAAWEAEIAALEEKLRTPTPELAASQKEWEETFSAPIAWEVLHPRSVTSRAGAPVRVLEDGSVLVGESGETEVTTLELPLPEGPLTDGGATALRIEALPHDSLPGKGPGHAGGNFVITRVAAQVVPPPSERPAGRFVRIELPGEGKVLSLAEVEVLSGGENGGRENSGAENAENVARDGETRQHSTAYDGFARLAIDGNTDGHYFESRSTTHTERTDDPWWEVDLGSEQPIDRIVVWNRTDGGLGNRLRDSRIRVLDRERRTVWESSVAEPPDPSASFSPGGRRSIRFAAALADHSQPGFEPARVLEEKDPESGGWAIGGATGRRHTLTLVASTPLEAAPGSTLALRIEQLSKHARHTVGRVRVALTADERAGRRAALPPRVLSIIETPRGERTEEQRRALARYYIAEAAPELDGARKRLRDLRKRLDGMKPRTSVPVLRELPEERRRTTRIQRRGNFLDTGREVTRGLPSAFHPPPEGAPLDRLTLARWLVDDQNPLTARVVVNRYWEKLFGAGIVRTSEEFGAQGELPSHPELLDGLAVELVEKGWDVKRLLRLIVTSATYRQSSRVSPELLERDSDNRLLARGPRFRLSAEAIRDQALFVSGLLSRKMYGPPVRPPQPSLGLNAAFGSGIDWKTSEGEDRYRRGIYTNWRRSNPYPSLTTFDAPNREVCTVRRERTNTPLQALVTLNDPVYVEAAQALARRMAARKGSVADKARRGFRLALGRRPTETELARLERLYEDAQERFSRDAKGARLMATDPLGPAPEGSDLGELAAWTVVGNVLLNLDEMFMKR